MPFASQAECPQKLAAVSMLTQAQNVSTYVLTDSVRQFYASCPYGANVDINRGIIKPITLLL